MANITGRWETNADTGDREYVFTELSGQKRTGRVPKRVASKALSLGSYGDVDVTEWAIAKLAADVSTFDGRMKRLTNGADADRLHAMVDAMVAEKTAKMRAAMVAAGLDPDAV